MTVEDAQPGVKRDAQEEAQAAESKKQRVQESVPAAEEPKEDAPADGENDNDNNHNASEEKKEDAAPAEEAKQEEAAEPHEAKSEAQEKQDIVANAKPSDIHGDHVLPAKGEELASPEEPTVKITGDKKPEQTPSEETKPEEVAEVPAEEKKPPVPTVVNEDKVEEEPALAPGPSQAPQVVAAEQEKAEAAKEEAAKAE